jgi:hypothetical protein
LLGDSTPADERCLADGYHWVAEKDIDGILARIEFRLTRDEVVTNVVNLRCTKNALVTLG